MPLGNISNNMYLVPSGTLPLSEYHRPIYQSLPLDHFKTPHHVHDLNWDSEQHPVTKSHNSFNTISSSNVKHAHPMVRELCSHSSGIRELHNLIVEGICIGHEESNNNKTERSLC